MKLWLTQRDERTSDGRQICWAGDRIKAKSRKEAQEIASNREPPEDVIGELVEEVPAASIDLEAMRDA